MTYVSTKSSDSYNLPGGDKKTFDRETVPLSVGDSYVLFLREAPDRPEYEGQYGDVVWAHESQPSISQVDPDTGNLQFKTTKTYRNAVNVLPTSGAPFELSRGEILELVSTGAKGSATE